MPHLKVWPFSEGHWIVIPVLSMGQTWPRKYTRLGRRTPGRTQVVSGGCPLTLPPELVFGAWVSSQQHQASPNGVSEPGQGRK